MGLRVFRWTVAITVILFLSAIAAWPVLAALAAQASGCQRVSGACGPVLIIFGLYGRSTLILLAMLVTLVIVVLRSRSLGLPLVATLTVLTLFPSITPLATTINNFWGVGFVTGAVSPAFQLFSLFAAMSPLIVAGFVIWNLGSSKREDFFHSWQPDPFQMRWLNIFSGLLLAGSLLRILSLFSVIPGFGEVILFLSSALSVPNQAINLFNRMIGVGVICFLWYSIGRWPAHSEQEQGEFNSGQPSVAHPA